MKNVLDSDKPIIFLGDHHGAWDMLFDLLEHKRVTDCNLISVGDLGMGFQFNKDYEAELCNELNKRFNKKNIIFYGIRGNHDDPSFFAKKTQIQLTNFKLIEDYSVFKYKNQTLQFIGGAISIDRTGRKEGVSYWKTEKVDYVPTLCKKVDILVTHTAPSFCFPQTFNEIVYGWAAVDNDLVKELTEERAVMDNIFKLCQPSFHVYGHFHSSWTENINNCNHRLLNINELWTFEL